MKGFKVDYYAQAGGNDNKRQVFSSAQFEQKEKKA